MQSRFKFYLLITILFFLQFVHFNCGEKLETKRKKIITVGRILPLTGPAASYGKSEQKGTLLALDEINSKGGINGDTLKIIFEDSQCKVQIGVNAMNKLVNIDKVPAVLGATISGITLAISPIANQKKVLLLSPLSSLSSITEAGPFVFRVMPSDAFQSQILAKWIFSEGYTNIAMFAINNAWGKGVSEEFEKIYKDLGGKIIIKEYCNVNEDDFRLQLTKIKSSNPDALFCPTMPKEGGKILKQMIELGIQLPVFGGDAWSVAELTDEAGNVAEGVMYSYPAQYNGKEYQDFSEAFSEKYDEDPDVNAAGAYDAVKILALCISQVIDNKLELTGDNLRKEMMHINNYKGATGTTSFDENGDSIGKTFERMIIKNGQRIKYE